MPSQVSTPKHVVDSNLYGTVAWTNVGIAVPNPTLATADGNSADVTLSTGQNSHYLVATRGGFSIPDLATIVGIQVEWLKRGTSTSGQPDTSDAAARIVKGSVIQATDRLQGTWPTGGFAYIAHGGATDLWGNTWTPADINGNGFGAALAATDNDASIDHVRITVYLTPGGVQQSRQMTRVRQLLPPVVPDSKRREPPPAQDDKVVGPLPFRREAESVRRDPPPPGGKALTRRVQSAFGVAGSGGAPPRRIGDGVQHDRPPVDHHSSRRRPVDRDDKVAGALPIRRGAHNDHLNRPPFGGHSARTTAKPDPGGAVAGGVPFRRIADGVQQQFPPVEPQSFRRGAMPDPAGAIAGGVPISRRSRIAAGIERFWFANAGTHIRRELILAAMFRGSFARLNGLTVPPLRGHRSGAFASEKV